MMAIAPWMREPEVSSTWGHCAKCDRYVPTVHSPSWTKERGAGVALGGYTCPTCGTVLDQEGISERMEEMFEALEELRES